MTKNPNAARWEAMAARTYAARAAAANPALVSVTPRPLAGPSAPTLQTMAQRRYGTTAPAFD